MERPHDLRKARDMQPVDGEIDLRFGLRDSAGHVGQQGAERPQVVRPRSAREAASHHQPQVILDGAIDRILKGEFERSGGRLPDGNASVELIFVGKVDPAGKNVRTGACGRAVLRHCGNCNADCKYKNSRKCRVELHFESPVWLQTTKGGMFSNYIGADHRPPHMAIIRQFPPCPARRDRFRAGRGRVRVWGPIHGERDRCSGLANTYINLATFGRTTMASAPGR